MCLPTPAASEPASLFEQSQTVQYMPQRCHIPTFLKTTVGQGREIYITAITDGAIVSTPC